MPTKQLILSTIRGEPSRKDNSVMRSAQSFGTVGVGRRMPCMLVARAARSIVALALLRLERSYRCLAGYPNKANVRGAIPCSSLIMAGGIAVDLHSQAKVWCVFPRQPRATHPSTILPLRHCRVEWQAGLPIPWRTVRRGDAIDIQGAMLARARILTCGRPSGEARRGAW